MLSRCCFQYVSKYERLSSGCRTGKSQFSSHFPRRVVTKECTDHWTIAVISQASKVMLNILHARLQHYENQELPDVQAGFRKGRGTRDQIANIYWIIEKPREFQKNIYLCFINYTQACDCVQFSCSVMSDSLRPHALQHARLPCPPPTPGACSNSGP